MKPSIAFTSRFDPKQAGGIESVVRELAPRVAELRPEWNVLCVHAFERQTWFNRIPLFGDLIAAVILWWRTRPMNVVVVNGGEYVWPRILDARTRRRTVSVWHGTRAGEIPSLVPRMSAAVQIYRVLEIWLQRWALFAYRQIAVSSTTVEELRTTYGFHPVVTVAINGAPPLPPSISRARTKRPYRVGWIGTNPYKKGLDIAVASCRLARRSIPDIHLIAIGIGTEAGESEPWLERTGRLTHSAAIEHLMECSVLLASTRYEGCSVAIIEALSLGIPVIAGPRVAWMIGNGGAATDRLDADAFARALETVLGDDTSLARMSREAEIQARLFNWNHTAATYVTEIEACL